MILRNEGEKIAVRGREVFCGAGKIFLDDLLIGK